MRTFFNEPDIKNKIYWSYNLPLQAYEDESGKINILNYMPRKEAVSNMDNKDVNELFDEQTRKEFFEHAALRLENLAKLFRQFGSKEIDYVYDPTEGIE